MPSDMIVVMNGFTQKVGHYWDIMVIYGFTLTRLCNCMLMYVCCG